MKAAHRSTVQRQRRPLLRTRPRVHTVRPRTVATTVVLAGGVRNCHYLALQNRAKAIPVLCLRTRRKRFSAPIFDGSVTVRIRARVDPRARVDVFDVRAEVSSRYGDALSPILEPLLFLSHDRWLSRPRRRSQLNQSPDGVMPYIDVFRTMFPEGAGMSTTRSSAGPSFRRTATAGAAECRLASGLHGEAPSGPRRVSESAERADVVHRSRRRSCRPGPDRHTSVIGYSAEEAVATAHRRSGFGPQCRQSVNLKDPNLGV
jgi:hypothetical protein